MMQTETTPLTPQDTQVPDGRMDISAEDLGAPTDEPLETEENDTTGADDNGEEKNADGGNADKPAADATGDTDGDDAKGEQAKDPARREADGLKGDLIDTRKELRATKEELAEAKRKLEEREAAERAAQSRNYDEELSALDERYDNGDFDSFAEFQKARDEVIEARATESALARHHQKQVEQQELDRKQAWDSAVDAFLSEEGNETFNDDIMAAALATAIQSEFAAGETDSQKVLSKAKEAVLSRLGQNTEAGGNLKAETEAERRKRQAAASAAGAAQVPSPVQGGGAGMRSQAGIPGELSPSVAAKDWASMSKAQQEEALGKPV